MKSLRENELPKLLKKYHVSAIKQKQLLGDELEKLLQPTISQKIEELESTKKKRVYK
jgi:hypothetical protein